MAWQKAPQELIDAFDAVFPEHERAERRSDKG
jgi:hypothetical protein